jgi:hypothetical protein
VLEPSVKQISGGQGPVTSEEKLGALCATCVSPILRVYFGLVSEFKGFSDNAGIPGEACFTYVPIC